MNIVYTIIEKYCLANEETRFLILYNGYDRKMDIKFRVMADIQHNLFVMPKIKLLISDLFYKAQRSYYALSRFSRIYMLRKAKIPIEHDLYLNPIDKNNRKSLQLYDRSHKSLYYFTCSDLVRIINTSLTHSRNYFIEPLECKNPYTNTPFTKSMLYTIYFHIQKTYTIIPPLLQAFFMDNFNLELFAIHNEQLIRNMCVDSFLKNSSIDILYDEVMHMFALLRIRRINISSEFPKHLLVEVMRPYLYLYCTYMYSIQGTEQRYIYYTILRRKMIEFRDYNPQFGRKIIKMSSNANGREKKIKIDFNSESPKLTIRDIDEIISKKTYRMWYSYGWNVPSSYTAQISRYSSAPSLYRTDVDSDPEDNIIMERVAVNTYSYMPIHNDTSNTNTSISNPNNNGTNTTTNNITYNHDYSTEDEDDEDNEDDEDEVVIASESESESEEMDYDY